MTDFSDYSLSGCLVDEAFTGSPTLTIEGPQSLADVLGALAAGQLPPRVDMRKYCSPVENQQGSNSCVGNAVIGALELLQSKSGHSSQDLSRLFLYYNARSLHGAEQQDKGTFVHLAMAALIATGVCEERMWPFSMVTLNDPPTKACYENAQHYRGVEFAEIQRRMPLLPILAQEIPVIIGVELPRAAYLEAARTGVMAIPDNSGGGGGHQHGRHAMVVVGYDIEHKAYIVRNSWGESFADGGYFLMPFSILEQSGMQGQMWAIGALNRAPGLKLLGASVEQSVQGMVAAAAQQHPSAALATDRFSMGLRGEVEGRLDAAKKGFASRLRNK